MTNDSIQIRKLNATDIPEAMKLVHAEGWNQTENDWRILIDGPQNVCFAAKVEDQLVGTATAINYNNNVAWIGMVLVNRQYRGRGISKILLSVIFDNLKTCKSIKLDATPAGQKVYEKLGFKDEYEIHRMVRLPGPFAGMAINDHINPAELQQDVMQEVVLFDAKVFGANREMLLKSLAAASHELSMVTRDDKKVTGFALGRVGSRYVQIGPVSAGSTEEAQTLVASILNLKNQHAIVVDAMDSKKELVDWLESVGFVVQRSFTRMYLGENPFPGLIEKQYLICGPEFG